ncbi:hypothetical protein BH23GEM9_BH23GEM9_33470 [soil metagenome]
MRETTHGGDARTDRDGSETPAASEGLARAGAAGGGAFDAASLLREIAIPRLTGTDGAARAGAVIRGHFEALGYDVNERSFRFNPWPGRFGITAAGALYLIGTLTAAAFIFANRPFAAVSMLLILLVLVGLMALFIRPAIDALRWGSREGVNMIAQRRGRRLRYIVMAHRDSKSQPVPLAFRGPAIVVGILVWVALLIGALAHAARPLPSALLLVLTALAALAGIGLILCWVDNNSPGALDNGSGVVAALGIARRQHEAGDVGFLITDAEELGLAGASAAAAHLPPVFGIINLDGLDDHGPFYVLERFGVLRKRGLAPHLAAALLQEAEARGEPANRRDLPLGIPVDHIPMVKAGIPALTVMRGTVRSLNRVHRPADSVDRLSGDGINRAVDLVSGALVRLREQAQSLEKR